MIYSVEVEAIAAAVNVQYMEDIKEDYVCYNNQTIKTMVDKLQTWYVITTK